MTLGEIVNQVKRNISFHAPEIDDSILVIANQVMRRIERLHDWSFTLTTETIETKDAQGNPTDTIPLPSLCKQVHFLVYDPQAVQTEVPVVISYISDEFLLTHLGQKWQTEAGKPRGFLLRSDQIVLVPPPDAVYKLILYYRQWLPEFTSFSDSNKFTENYPDMFTAFLTSQILFQLGEPQEAALWEQRANLMLVEAIKHDKLMRVSQPAYVAPMLPPTKVQTGLGRWEVKF